ncbi:hypothetical protein [Thalassoroseus pseudoceratinae]|uniref:hypothetical protein n=1 Tax=Thalassoroseus pseudoceratinae TaxID=2713176 RepID=UPI0014228EC3|nr:hypothetical protein [Thalassoroseus pseudoceratinae]
MSNVYIGKPYRSVFDTVAQELRIDGMIIAIHKTGIKREQDTNLIGTSIDDGIIRWELGGLVDDDNAYEGIVDICTNDGDLWAATWSGFSLRIDPERGDLLETVFTR